MTYAEKRTRAHFQNAFIKMIKEAGYSKITVRKLVECADYNRTSFYRYYNNLDELSEEITEHIITLFHESYIKEMNNPDYNKITPNIYRTVYENSKFFDLLAIDDTIPQLKERFIKCIEYILKNESSFEDDEQNILNNEYVHFFRAYGTFGMIETWIKNNYSLDYITFAKYIQKLYSGPFYLKKQ